MRVNLLVELDIENFDGGPSEQETAVLETIKHAIAYEEQSTNPAFSVQVALGGVSIVKEYHLGGQKVFIHR